MPILSTISSASVRSFGGFSSKTKTHLVTNPITSGLQFQLDFSDPNCYSGSGTQFYDLSGNGRHGVINNTSGVSFVAKNGDTPAYMNFAGTSDSHYIYQNAGSSAYVYDVVVGMMVTDANSFLACVYSYTGASDKSLRLNEDGPNNRWGFRGGSVAPDGNDWQIGQEALTTINNNSNIAYPNYYPTNTWGVMRSYTSNGNFSQPHSYMMGANAYPGRQLRGRINFVLAYNRQLSTSEVTQIFNAYKSRLGIA